MAEITLTGYCDRFSVKPGQEIAFMVSAEGTDQADVQLVQLIHGDETPGGPGFVEKEVPGPIDGSHAVGQQFTQDGNFARVADPECRLAFDGSFTLWAYVWPTTPAKGRQGILTRWSIEKNRGYALGINTAGALEFWVGNGRKVEAVHAEVELNPRQWYLVAASYERSSGRVLLYQRAIENRYANLWSKVVPLDMDSFVTETLPIVPVDAELDFLWGGSNDHNAERGDFVSQLYNGKIDRCGIITHAMNREELELLRETGPEQSQTFVYWDTSAGYSANGIGDDLVDIGPYGLHAEGQNRPVRAATGYNWNGKDDCFRLAPEQFGGVWFHDDAITDCKWDPTFTMTVPELKSGVYAARLRAGEVEDHLCFFVRPREPKAAIAMLMPTCSYLAYANDRLGLDYPTSQLVSAHVPVFHKWDMELAKHPEYGASTYDSHSDGGGVC